jgi:hypothetical protein
LTGFALIGNDFGAFSGFKPAVFPSGDFQSFPRIGTYQRLARDAAAEKRFSADFLPREASPDPAERSLWRRRSGDGR